MSDTAALTEGEQYFNDVELISLGRQGHGSLLLTKHHIVFMTSSKRLSAPTNGTPNPVDVSLPSTSLSTASMPDPIHGRDYIDRRSTDGVRRSVEHFRHGRNADGSRYERSEQRTQEMWIPYPMVHHCILRPSPSHTSNVRPQALDPQAHAAHAEDELFPPTVGTASYERQSSDSAGTPTHTASREPVSLLSSSTNAPASMEFGRQPAIRIRLKDFRMLALHFHSTQPGQVADEIARRAFYTLRSRCCISKLRELHAFSFSSPREEAAAHGSEFDVRREFARMGVGGKVANGPGAAWRLTDINQDYSYSPTYPNVLCVPQTVSDNLLKYSGTFRSRSRIPCLTYLHSNGGSITRSSQPMVGVQNRRNPQDERLVSAIFASHTPPTAHAAENMPEGSHSVIFESNGQSSSTGDGNLSRLATSRSETALDQVADETSTPRQRIYGSTRRSLIVDARPRINALANRATGGGIEDVTNYTGNGETPVEKAFLNIANIHVMRSSLDKVVESFASSDYIKMKPDAEALRKSGWLGHIAGLIDGAEMVARVVGLSGSHVLVHCSDGWDRTSQVAALAQVMLDPYYRTFDGFITLVQKDFVSFGHKFRDRNGIEGSEKWFEIENERIAPSRNRENATTEPTSLNALGTKAFAGAKSWFDKNRGSIFRQQNKSQESLADRASSRPSSPPPNALLHAPPVTTDKAEKEHKMSEKEVSPIFHQFLDAVYQLQRQSPEAFEFKERFLRRLFYHAYSCQYGEFIFNTEHERAQHKGKTSSVWSHFRSRRKEFVKPEFVTRSEDPLLFPKRYGAQREVEVMWWHDLFGRTNEEMNLPRALAPSDQPASTASLESTVSFDETVGDGQGHHRNVSASLDSLKERKSTPSLVAVDDSPPMPGVKEQNVNNVPSTGPITLSRASDPQVLPIRNSIAGTDEKAAVESTMPVEKTAGEHGGDPLGAVSAVTSNTPRRRMDFAAFASQNAFSDRS